MLRNLDLKIIYGTWIFAVVALIIILPLISATEGDYIDSFSVAGEGISDPIVMAANNDFIWVGAYSTDLVYKYFPNGTYTGESWTNHADQPYMYSMVATEDYIWIADDSSDTVYKYNLDGTYTGVGWDPGGTCSGSCPAGIAVVGNYIWIADGVNDLVYKYFLNGTYTGISWSFSGIDILYNWGLAYYNGYFWISGYDAISMHKYYENGTYIGFWNFTAANAQGYGTATNGSFIWVLDRDDDVIYKYEGPGAVAVDTCTCAGAGNDWEIDHSDYCNITDACDLTTGTLSFTGAGITKCDAVIETTNLGDPGATGILKILSDCLIWIKGT